MKIVCDRERLLSAFSIAATVANPRSPKEILQYVKMLIGPQKVSLMATDMENGIRIEIAGGIEEKKPGEALLPVARVGLILRESRDQLITIRTEGSDTIIETATSNFKLPTANPNEYPNVVSFSETAYHEISARLLKDMIRRTSFATDQESSRFALGGVLFEMAGEEVFAVGTDGRRMARMVGTGMSVGGHEPKPFNTIIPTRGLALVAKAIGDLSDDDTVDIAARANDVVIKTAHATITCRLVEGRFPNWKQVIPTDRKSPTLVDLNVGPFASGIRQAAIVADVETHGLDFLFDENELVISARTANLGTSRVSVEIDYDAPHSIEMKLDYRYLSDFLRLLDPESKCTANLASSSQSVLFTTDDGYSYVVMPMALER